MTSTQHDQDKYQHAISMLLNNSVDLAIRKLLALSKDGDGHADAVLGALYEFGRGELAVDKGKALACYERSVASVGSLEGWMGIGRISLYGPPELRDFDRALECFSLVANRSNYSQAWLALGEIYLRGVDGKQDLEAAARCFQKAADLGNVFGYTGLARVASKQRKAWRSIKYRVVAVIKAFGAQECSENLHPGSKGSPFRR